MPLPGLQVALAASKAYTICGTFSTTESRANSTAVQNNFERQRAQFTVFVNHHYRLQPLRRRRYKQKKTPEVGNVHALNSHSEWPH